MRRRLVGQHHPGTRANPREARHARWSRDAAHPPRVHRGRRPSDRRDRASRAAPSIDSASASVTPSAIEVAHVACRRGSGTARRGRWSSPATDRESSVDTDSPPMVASPHDGATRPRIASSNVDLPDPLGPTSATISPGRGLQVDGSGASATNRVVDDDGPQLDSMVPPATSPVRRGWTATPAARATSAAASMPVSPAWYAAPTGGSAATLGSEQQHDQRGAEHHRAGGEPDADLDRDQRDRQRGEQLEREGGQERDAQRCA